MDYFVLFQPLLGDAAVCRDKQRHPQIAIEQFARYWQKKTEERRACVLGEGVNCFFKTMVQYIEALFGGRNAEVISPGKCGSIFLLAAAHESPLAQLLK